MMRLIQNLLEISKIEEGKLPVRRERDRRSRSVADEVVARVRAVAEQGRAPLRSTSAADLRPPSPIGLCSSACSRTWSSTPPAQRQHRDQVEAARGPQRGLVTLRVIDRSRHRVPGRGPALIFEKFRSVRAAGHRAGGGDRARTALLQARGRADGWNHRGRRARRANRPRSGWSSPARPAEPRSASRAEPLLREAGSR